MGKLTTLQPRVQGLEPRRQPWQKGALAAQRLTGRALMVRNQRIKERDSFKCAACGRIGDAMDVDHVIPLSAGGRDNDENLQLLCRGAGLCHDQKTLADRHSG